MDLPHEWLVPQWSVPARVKSVFTTRSGGVSVGPFESFNLGEHVSDAPAAVRDNRMRLTQMCGARPVFLRQVHGREVVILDEQTPDGTLADACLTTRSGLACTVMVADCLPVLWCSADGAMVAASHAGWRGLAGEGGRGVLEATVEAMLASVHPNEHRQWISELSVWLGPCIGPRAFEVGSEVRDAFVVAQPAAVHCFDALDAPGKSLAHLAALARLRLERLGVTHVFGNDGSDAWCTVTHASRFFSHRRDAARLGSSGRMAACIWLT